MYRSICKRCLDVIVAGSVLFLTFPLILLVAVALSWINKGNPFFFQDRPGFRERKITIIKFKSMLDLKDDTGKLLPDNDRLTFLGKWIRKLSIDELPQLINVLKGDMSLVGPRPLLYKYLSLYTEEQRRRHEVKPGITGWAQVNGRNSISWSDRFKYDVYYVDNISFFFDLKIMIRTVLKVIMSEGINQSKERPMQPFDGTN